MVRVSTKFDIIRPLLDLLWIIGMPVIFNCIQPFNFSRCTVNTITIDDGSGLGIATAVRSVVLSQDELKVDVALFFSVESDAVQRNALRVNVIAR